MTVAFAPPPFELDEATAAYQELDPQSETARAIWISILRHYPDHVDPTDWLRHFFPGHCRRGFGVHHLEFWRWVWGIRRGVRSSPFLGVWSRGGAKSTSAELACVALGARRARKYGLYVCETQDQADDHVGNIANMLDSSRLADAYPELCARAVGKYGSSRGWRRNRLFTASGLVIDAIGLDTAARGAKIDEDRPDFGVIDDVDDLHDSPAAVTKKLDTLGRSILLAGADDFIPMLIQNLIHADGVVAQMVDKRTDILRDRILSGPIPALLGGYSIEAVEVDDHDDPDARPWRIVGDPEPTWEGQDIEACEKLLALVGPTNFRVECQHETGLAIQGMFADVLPGVKHCTRDEVPDLVRKAIAVDPAVTDTDHSDSHGVQCDGIDKKGVIYRLRSWEKRASPGQALEMAVTWAYEEGVAKVYVEMVGTDMTGRSVEQSWVVAFGNAVERVLERHPEWRDRPVPKIERVAASSSTGAKASRASRMHTDYEAKGRIVHVTGPEGYHTVLEAALGRVFEVKPFDLADAAYYSWRVLRRMRKVRGVGPADLERAATGLPKGFRSPNYGDSL